jgi:hypothetical protein
MARIGSSQLMIRVTILLGPVANSYRYHIERYFGWAETMGSLHLQCVALMTTRELSRVQIFESLLANAIAVYDPRYTYLVRFALLCIKSWMRCMS